MLTSVLTVTRVSIVIYGMLLGAEENYKGLYHPYVQEKSFSAIQQEINRFLWSQHLIN